MIRTFVGQCRRRLRRIDNIDVSVRTTVLSFELRERRFPFATATPTRFCSSSKISKKEEEEDESKEKKIDAEKMIESTPSISSSSSKIWKERLLSSGACFVGMSALSLLATCNSDQTMLLLGSFGASSVLIFGAHGVPFSQPRNVVGGHVLSSTVGSVTYALVGNELWFAGPVAVAASLFLMQATKTVHPPAGGTALISVIGSQKIHALGLFLPVPVGVGAAALVGLGAIVNRGLLGRNYPIMP